MRVRHRLEALLVWIVRLLVTVLPMRAVRKLGHGFGLIAYVVEGPRRRTALENLASAFPGRSPREQRQLARAVFGHFGALIFELIKFSSWSREQMLAAVDIEGEERLRQGLQEGRGVLIFTGHFGYWEILALAHAVRVAPMSVLARPLDNRQLDEMLEHVRTCTGNTVIPRRGAVRRILRELGAGRTVGILIDQHLHEADAVYVGFFQRPAATTSALAALALRTGAPVIPVFALPLPRGRYRLIYEHPVDPPVADTPDAVREFTQRCTDVLEMYVRRHPELWMWLHRRWREPGFAEPGSGIRDPQEPGTRNQEPENPGSRTPDPGRRMSDPAHVLVVAPNWLGDVVMALPAVADVRRQFPDARLTIAARRTVAPVFRLVPFVDNIVTLEWSGRWWQRRACRDDVARLRATGAEVAILLPNSFASAWLVRQAAIPERWGYASDLRRPLLSRAVPRPAGSMHQGAYYQHLTRELGIDSGPLEPVLDVPDAVADAARRFLVERGWQTARPLVAFAPGTAYGTAKRWMPEYVAQVATSLVRERGATCVLVGSRADRDTALQIRAGLSADVAPHVLDVTGDTTIERLAGVMAAASACVSNDSGAMHVAAAVGTPLVALFGPTNEYETAPLTREGRRAVVLTHPVWCRPCMLRECPIDHRCMKRITPERVYGTLDDLVARVRLHPSTLARGALSHVEGQPDLS